jgi:hypothetical protein
MFIEMSQIGHGRKKFGVESSELDCRVLNDRSCYAHIAIDERFPCVGSFDEDWYAPDGA